MGEAEKVGCAQHGDAFETFICEHLAEDPAQTWYSNEPRPGNEWPDSWCSRCHVAYLRENEWNEENEGELRITLLCHRCYEAQRALGNCVLLPESEVAE
jgi:hypothetical protein